MTAIEKSLRAACAAIFDEGAACAAAGFDPAVRAAALAKAERRMRALVRRMRDAEARVIDVEAEQEIEATTGRMQRTFEQRKPTNNKHETTN